MIRVLKAAGGLVVLVVLVVTVMGWLGDYRDAAPETPRRTPDATSTTEPTSTSGGDATETPSAEPKTLVVLIDGLNMRSEPSGERIGGLKKGEKLTLLKTQDSWYQVRTAKKKVGWITANPQYTKAEE